ncbi:MAG: TetR family transcriptional regulator [Rectinemataceae bacterium]
MTQEILASDPDWPYSKAKTAVLAAAVAVISEGGPRAATLKNIATRANITEPAIFRHFDGVDGLFGGLFEAFELVHARMENVFEVEERGLERLLKGLFALVDLVAASEDFSYILVHGEHVFRAYSDLHERLGEHRLRQWRKLLACVEEGAAAGKIRRDIDAQSLALAAQGSIHMTILSWIEDDFGFDLREACESRIAMIERMLTPTEALGSLPRRSAKSAGAKSARTKPAAKTALSKSGAAKRSGAKAAGAKPRAASGSGRRLPAADSAKAKVKPRAKAAVVAKRR